MLLEQLAIADGRIDHVRTSADAAEIVFTDWRETTWLLRFPDVLAVENLNIEGQDLDGIEVRCEDEYLQRVLEVVDEPRGELRCYVFITAWNPAPRLRIVAAGCEVSAIVSGGSQTDENRSSCRDTADHADDRG